MRCGGSASGCAPRERTNGRASRYSIPDHIIGSRTHPRTTQSASRESNSQIAKSVNAEGAGGGDGGRRVDLEGGKGEKAGWDRGWHEAARTGRSERGTLRIGWMGDGSPD